MKSCKYFLSPSPAALRSLGWATQPCGARLTARTLGWATIFRPLGSFVLFVVFLLVSSCALVACSSGDKPNLINNYEQEAQNLQPITLPQDLSKGDRDNYYVIPPVGSSDVASQTNVKGLIVPPGLPQTSKK